MKQLTLKVLENLIKELKEKYGEEEALAIPVYIGQDDELNGVHTAWYSQEVNIEEPDDWDLIEMIEEGSNAPFDKKAVLIS